MKDLARLLRLVRPYWAWVGGAVFLMLLAGLCEGAMLKLVGVIFDRVLSPGGKSSAIDPIAVPQLHWQIDVQQYLPSQLHELWYLVAAGILLVFAVKGLSDYLGNYLINYAGFSAVTDLRQRVFDHVLYQDAQFFENNSTGRLMSSIMNDLEKIQVATSHILADLLRQFFKAAVLLYIVIETDRRLALFSLTVLPFVLVPTVRLGRKIRRSTRSAQDNAAELNQILQETITGHQVVKSFGAEEIESNRFHVAAQRLKKSNLRYVAQQAVASPLIEFFGAITIVALLTYARQRIQGGHLTSGEFTTFVFALLLLYEPVKRLAGIYAIFQQAFGASQKVYEYLGGATKVAEKPGALKLAAFEKSIVFEDVSFRYPTTQEGFVLDSIRLTVRQGEVVALVGPSGAGKSTLANLVPRFYDVAAGRVLVDGHDVRDLTLASLRAKISMVAQDTFLFNDTVAANIGYGYPDARESDIRAAAKNALADEFIERLPDAYNTMIGERGLKLSGGQRQRIAIARALLKNAPILILDEATSHLDSESEILVQRALANLMADRTVIVIAHRLSTIRRADRIVVLERGRICETGKHEELVNRGGVYQRLHELQFSEIVPEP